ncbi:ABC transporter permease [Actinomadura atramentaria]|uniref:ABC transporter permease n=1 Tax=Actinomadura atramentaria TaxID=1990 RepID=UPI00035C0A42|nr:ABC transporter permease subunit [Actinomadura atramentaria]
MTARRVGGAAGVLALVAAWWIAAVTVFRSTGTVPSPWTVLASVRHDGWALYGPNLGVTAAGAAKGFLWGNGTAVALALLVALLPRLEPLATQLAVLSYCTPLLALGPIVLVVFGGRTPTVFLAAVSVFFTSMVGTLAGLRSADRAGLDLVTACGGGRWQRLVRVQAIAALPGVVGALKIAAPAAVLGAILGEYLGGVDSGVGVALTAAQAAYDVPRTWGMALAAGALAGAGYLLAALLGRATDRLLYGPRRREAAA